MPTPMARLHQSTVTFIPCASMLRIIGIMAAVKGMLSMAAEDRRQPQQNQARYHRIPLNQRDDMLAEVTQQMAVLDAADQHEERKRAASILDLLSAGST